MLSEPKKVVAKKQPVVSSESAKVGNLLDSGGWRLYSMTNLG